MTEAIAEDQRGFGLGELLLKTAFNYAVANRYEHVYLTTFPQHAELITLVEDFGFESDLHRLDDDLHKQSSVTRRL
jgi:GNAT superfamily N-acetyltransferase